MNRWFIFLAVLLATSPALRAQQAAAALEPVSASPATPPKVALSMVEMEERLAFLENALEAYQEQVVQLRSELRALKVSTETKTQQARRQPQPRPEKREGHRLDQERGRGREVRDLAL
jgi:hypothetical protein